MDWRSRSFKLAETSARYSRSQISFNLFSAQRNLVNSREVEAQSLVQLYLALGGNDA